MTSQHQSLDTIQDIKRMMERSSRFISLSGWSGVSAGICALIGAWLANKELHQMLGAAPEFDDYSGSRGQAVFTKITLFNDLIIIAVCTFVAALISSFFFTWLRTRKHGVPLWDRTVQRLIVNTALP